MIVDTGSSDGTQKIIREFLSDIPGELYEHKWVNFGHNRNEALKLAKGKGDYILLIDADEKLEGSFDKKALQQDLYLASIRTCPTQTFLRAFLVNNHLHWEWKGAIHESLLPIDKRTIQTMQNVVIAADTSDGHRSQDPQKYLKDAKIFEEALLKDPNNSDNVYYLAQCYFNAKEYHLALKNYEKRAAMDGWDQLTFWSKYRIAYLQELLQMNSSHVIKSYCDAFHFRPTRAEPIYRLASHFYHQKNIIMAYLLTQFGLTIPLPDDIVYVEKGIYSYEMLSLFTDCAMQLGKQAEAAQACEKIGNNKEAPPALRQKALTLLQSLK